MNQILSISITFILWQAYAYMEGKIEANFYRILNGRIAKNMHGLYLVNRSIVYSIIIAFNLFYVWDSEMWGVCKVIQTIFVLLIYPAVFNFWHNGAYFSTQNDLLPTLYVKRWSADSDTSEAKHNTPWKQRLESFVIGVLFFIGAIINVIINR